MLVLLMLAGGEKQLPRQKEETCFAGPVQREKREGWEGLACRGKRTSFMSSQIPSKATISLKFLMP